MATTNVVIVRLEAFEAVITTLEASEAVTARPALIKVVAFELDWVASTATHVVQSKKTFVVVLAAVRQSAVAS